MDLESNVYKFSEDDLYEALEFVINYHLDPTKGQSGRTNQGKRSFGGELDEFLPGKLVEIAVCRILERNTKNKTILPDFEIYSNQEVGLRSDPDITKIIENSSERQPKTFVEIKRFDPKARWMGPRSHQLKNMENGYMIHASIEFDDDLSIKKHDVTASILKKLIFSNKINLSEFSNFENLEAKIEYAYSFTELRDKGHFFASGNIIPETDFKKSSDAYNKDQSIRKNLNKINNLSGINKIKMKWENRTDDLSFSEWEIIGDCEIFQDKFGKEFIFAKNDSEMFSEVFGTFKLEKGLTYRFHFTNTLGKKGGKDVYKSIDDYWFSKKRLDELISNGEINNSSNLISTIASEI